MAPPSKSRFWCRCRTCFRWCRITVWLLILALCVGILYLNRTGLPEFVKRPLLETLRERGMDLEFTRLRLLILQGIVADDVRFGKADGVSGPRLSAQQVEFNLDLSDLARFRLRVEEAVLHHGRFEWPLGESNAPTRMLAISNIQTTLRLLPGDVWSLDNFRAELAGARFNLSAVVTNATAIRDWKFLHGRRPAEPGFWQQRVRRLADTLEAVSFSSPPELRLTVGGDARDLQSFAGRFTLLARGANTPWGTASQTLFAVKLACAASNQPPRVELNLEVAQVYTRWGSVSDLHFNAAGVVLSDLPPPDASWGWWTNLQPYRLDWSLETGPVHANELAIGKLALAGQWQAPELSVTDLHAEWAEGDVDAQAKLDVLSRAAHFNLDSDVSVDRLLPLLTEKTRHWLDKFAWGSPPHLSGSGAVILPAWTNREPDWRAEVQPTLCLAGELAVTNASYQGIVADRAHTHFTYTNMVWHLPDLEIDRPEGKLRLAHEEDDRTKDYHWRIQGPIDPFMFRSMLPTNAHRGLDALKLSKPPIIDGDLWGRLYDYDRLGARAHITMTNFSFRGQSADWLATDVTYTNRIIEFTDPYVYRDGQIVTASVVRVDLPAERVYFTNGYSTAEPRAAAQVIGPKTAHILEPYHFLKPPTVYVKGYVSFHGEKDADLYFAVEGGPFECWKFRVKWVKGDVHWHNKSLFLENVQAPFYEGEAWGRAAFDFTPVHGGKFEFSADVTDMDLHAFMSGMSPRTNHLEGRVSGTLVVTSGDTTDKDSWQGHGKARLHDGLIWDIPIFGVLSPILNSIIPGMGTSRASEAATDFVITDSVVLTDQLEIRSPMLRLQYAGSVNSAGRVDARVDAEPLRDAWFPARVIGYVLTPVSKLFQYQVTGTLAEPKMEPVYIPKAFMFPFHPLRTLEELVVEEPAVTNVPPVKITPTNALPVEVSPTNTPPEVPQTDPPTQ